MQEEHSCILALTGLFWENVVMVVSGKQPPILGV